MPKLIVAGLGPGRAGLMTRETWNLLSGKNELFLRTRIHPTVEELDRHGISYTSYDAFYEAAGDFEHLYQKIADDLLHRAEKQDILYAVPGSPLVAERTVVLLQEGVKAHPKVTLEILPAMSFVEVLYTEIGIDPVEGLTILDAQDVSDFFQNARGCLTHPLLVTQVYDAFIAADLKLALMEQYDDEAPLLFLHNLALPDASVRKICLYELDRQKVIDHLTSVVLLPPKEKCEQGKAED